MNCVVYITVKTVKFSNCIHLLVNDYIKILKKAKDKNEHIITSKYIHLLKRFS